MLLILINIRSGFRWLKQVPNDSKCQSLPQPLFLKRLLMRDREIAWGTAEGDAKSRGKSSPRPKRGIFSPFARAGFRKFCSFGDSFRGPFSLFPAPTSGLVRLEVRRNSWERPNCEFRATFLPENLGTRTWKKAWPNCSRDDWTWKLFHEGQDRKSLRLGCLFLEI